MRAKRSPGTAPAGRAARPRPLGGGRLHTAREWAAATPEQRALRLAATQHGVLSRAQARWAGLSNRAVDERVRRGWLRRLHAGVYAVGGVPVTRDGHRAAALLASGHDAVVGHADAGELWEMVAVPGVRDAVEVIVPAERRVRRPELVVHRTRELPRVERRRVRGLPVTSPARTILDLAPRMTEAQLEATIADARHRGLVRDRELTDALARARRRPGAEAVAAVLARDGGPALTRSAAERLLLPALRAAGLVGFETNATVLGYEVDVLFPVAMLVVEIDGFATHGDRAAFERDRRRDADLLGAGYRVLRVTWRQLDRDAAAVVATIVAALDRA